MCAVIQDDNLKEIEHLIVEMEDLEQQITQKQEQQAFVTAVINEKQKQCQQAKGQHEEKIRSLSRQARKSRVRRAAPGGHLADTGADPIGSDCQDLRQAEDSSQAALDAIAMLDTRQLDEALGREQRQRLFGPGNDAGAEARGAGSLSEAEAEERLAAAKQALEERLDLLQCLNTRLADHMQLLMQAQAAGGPAGGHELDAMRSEFEFAALQSEVASLIEIDAM
mmetsp:Transcript_63858/g.144101  ORF Transcript_63858/g.144101 Transcript_63858/m.144101 type:complete len:224 (+) Transcript_63858:105-776(+)